MATPGRPRRGQQPSPAGLANRMNGSAIASSIGQSRTAVNLQRWAARTAKQASNHRRQEGDRQNRHHNQHEASIAAAVPTSVVTSAPLARMLGFRQYIAQAATRCADRIAAGPSDRSSNRRGRRRNHPSRAAEQQRCKTGKVRVDRIHRRTRQWRTTGD